MSRFPFFPSPRPSRDRGSGHSHGKPLEGHRAFRSTRIAFLAVVIGLAGPTEVQAGEAPDAVSSTAIWEQTMTWDNVRDAPLLVNDIAKRGAFARLLGRFGLRRNAPYKVKVPNDGWLQIHVPAGSDLALRTSPNRARRIDVYASNGSGLLKAVPLTHDAASGFSVAAGSAVHPTLYHLRARGRPARLAVYHQRRSHASQPSTSTPVPLDGRRVLVRDDPLKLPATYTEVRPEQPSSLRTTPGQILELEVRVPFAALSEVHTDYLLLLTDGDRLIERIDQRAYLDREKLAQVDGEPTLISRKQRLAVKVPPNSGRLRITATIPVLLRASQVESPRYLVPALNASPSAAPPFFNGDEPESTHGGEPNPQAVLALARDNLQEGGALRAAALTDTLTLEPMEQARLREQILARYTSLTDLLPSADEAAPETPFQAAYHRYEMPSLAMPRLQRLPALIGRAHLESAVDKLPGAWFVTAETEPLRYALPAQPFPTRMRLLIDTRGVVEPLRLSVQTANTSHELLLDPSQAAPALVDPPLSLETLTAGEALPGAALAAVELPLPPGEDQLLVQWHGEARPPTAIQIRTPRSEHGQERDWIDLVRFAGSELVARWHAMRQRGLDPDGRWIARQALAGASADWRVRLNFWVPLLHYLSENARTFEQSGRLRVARPHCAADEPIVQRVGPDAGHLTAAARALEAQQQWLAANEVWTRLLRVAEPLQCGLAHLAIANNLIELGEHDMAEHYLRTLMLTSNNLPLRTQAAESLHRYYEKQRLYQARVQLAAHQTLADPTTSNLHRLAQALADAGKNRLAMEIGLLDPALRNTPGVRTLIARRGWLQLLEQLDRLEPASSDPDIRVDPARLASPPIVQMSAGNAVLVRDRLLNEVSSQPVASPLQPVRALVRGPLRLRIAVRPLTDPLAAEPPKGWARVRVGEDVYALPVSSKVETDRFAADSEPGGVGARTMRELVLGPGLHEIEINPVNEPLLTEFVSIAPWPDGSPQTRPTVALANASFRLIEQPELEARSRSTMTSATRQTTRPGSLRLALPATPAELSGVAAGLADADSAGQLLANVAYLVDTQPPPFASALPDLIALSEQVAHLWSADRPSAAMRGRIRRHTEWSTLETIGDSAGMRETSHTHFAPESEATRTRELFLPPWRSGERLLAAGERMELISTRVTATPLRFEVTPISHLAQPSPVAAPSAQMDAGAIHNGWERDGEGWIMNLTLPAGNHSLQIEAPALLAGQSMKVRILERVDGNWVPVIHPLRRTHYLAGPGNSVAVNVHGPAWLRIDADDGNSITSLYRFVGPGWHVETIRGDRETGYRVFQRTLASDVRAPAALKLREASTAVSRWPGSATESGPLSHAARTTRRHVTDRSDTAATRSWQTSFVESSGYAEDARLSSDRYLEGAMTYRQHDEWTGAYRRTNLLARIRQAGSPTLGAGHRTLVPLGDSSLLGIIHTEAYLQQVDSNMDWSASLSATLRHTSRLTNTLRSNVELGAFARALSADDTDAERDRDVFSPYKRDHRQGLRAGASLTWRPWLDLELYSRAGAASNEADQFSLDYVRGDLGVRAHLGNVQLAGGYQRRWYFADQDRDEALTLDRLALSLRGYRWQPRQPALEIEASLTHDVERADTSFTVSLTWHLHGGRMLRDFHGDENWFEDLLNRNAMWSAMR